MTLRQLVSAWRGVQELDRLVLPYATTKALVRLKRQLQEEVETARAMEKSLMEAHGGTPGENGRISFRTPEDLEAFQTKYEAAMTQEVEHFLPPVDLTAYVEQVQLSPGAMEALEGIILFERRDG